MGKTRGVHFCSWMTSHDWLKRCILFDGGISLKLKTRYTAIFVQQKRQNTDCWWRIFLAQNEIRYVRPILFKTNITRVSFWMQGFQKLTAQNEDKWLKDFCLRLSSQALLRKCKHFDSRKPQKNDTI